MVSNSPISTKQTITSKQWWSTILPLSTKLAITSKQWWSTIQPISTKLTITSKQWWSAIHQYQQNKQSPLNSDDQHFTNINKTNNHLLTVMVSNSPISTKQTITSRQWWSTILPISTKLTITSKQWWSAIHQYQQNKQSPLNSDGQQFTNINKTNNHL